jgi:AMMECR1 domain-containing protein/orotate phosphoribosyltransferase
MPGRMAAGVKQGSQLSLLKTYLQRESFLFPDSDQRLLTWNGRSASWMFYPWAATMATEGARLVALCLLRRLREAFAATQIATYGYTGIPLVAGCVLLGDGRYTGLCIRTERERKAARRRIEGPGDRSRPVVVVDDSIGSGTTMLQAMQALEEEGFRVEGGLAIVSFPWRGGAAKVRDLGYRMEALFELGTDLPFPAPPQVPEFRRLLPAAWPAARIEPGLHPATAARRIAEYYVEHGAPPAPPLSLDREYDARGGVFVSLRDRRTSRRFARDGFWHFDPADADPCRDLTLATVKALRHAPREPVDLRELKVAVTFCGPLEPVRPAALDFSTFGIVVRGRAHESQLGGALPNTQRFTNELQQYRHALVTNAGIADGGPHDLYRHAVHKLVEPGEEWPAYGSPERSAWREDEALGRRLTGRVRALLRRRSTSAGRKVPDGCIPGDVFGVAVTLFSKGAAGCYVASDGSLDQCLLKATRRALRDQRFSTRRKGVPAEEIAVVVSILHDREVLGEVPVEAVCAKLRLGLDSLLVQQNRRSAVYLPMVAPHRNWTKEQLAEGLLRKAGIEGPPCFWATFQTTSWLSHRRKTYQLELGFPARKRERTSASVAREIALLARYVLRHLGEDGLPDYAYLPVSGERVRAGTAARVLSGLTALESAGRALGRQGWCRAARQGLRTALRCVDAVSGTLDLPAHEGSAMADCQLLAGVARSADRTLLDDRARRLAARVAAMLQPDGRVTDRPDARDAEVNHDTWPGAALLALAAYGSVAGDAPWLAGIDAQLDWQRRRFRMLRPWGMVGWQAQAWTGMYELTRNRAHADFVFELADWALDWQLAKSGAFLTTMHLDGPSFHTAFIGEGMADAWKLARLLGEEARARRYERSCLDACRFLDRLIIRPEDTFCMRDPALALGGVRGTPASCDVRIDYVGHCLLFLSKVETLSVGGPRPR